MKPPLLYCLAALLLFCAAAQAATVGDYLPEDKVQGHFMRVTYPPRANELFKKMQAAINLNRQWFDDAYKHSKPGEPLPYDEKMGLTPDEYKEFLALKKQAQLKEVLVREIRVVRNDDGTISLDGGGDLKQLGALKFDIVQNSVTTPYGELAHFRIVDQSAKGEGGVFGPHTGLEFHIEGGDPGSTIDSPSGKAVTLTMGKIAATGQRFISYSVTVMEDGRRTVGIDMILEY